MCVPALQVATSITPVTLTATMGLLPQMYPYATNSIRYTYGRTRNARDILNIFNESHGPEGEYDPVFKVDLLGGVISQGLIAYITMVRLVLAVLNTGPKCLAGRECERAICQRLGGD